MMNSSHRVYVPIVFALALLVGILVLRPLYTEYMDIRIESARADTLQSERQKELDALVALQSSFASSGSGELIEKVKKLNKKWDEAQVMSAVMLTDYTKGSLYLPAPIVIGNISLDPGKKLPSGLSLGTIKLSLTGKSIDDVVNFLSYLTSNSSYVFTLDTISLPLSVPIQKEVNGIALSVSL